MSNNEKMERVLSRFEPARRNAMRKILAGTVIYTAPVVASFSLDSLGGTAQAQAHCGNQTDCPPVAIPAVSPAGLLGLMAAIAGAALFRRRS